MISPYFENDDIILYHGDCLSILPELEANSIDLLLTDPPYGQEFQSNRRTDKLDMIVGDDGSVNVGKALSESCRLLKRGHHAYIFGPLEALDNTPLCATTPIIWDKMIMGMGDLTQPWGLSHEPITFAVNEPSKANQKKGAGRLAARMRKNSIIRCQRLQSAQVEHPNQKPTRLLRELIESSSCFDDVIFDPFAGSGSTLEAAVLEGRKAIGIEVDEKYCEMIADRINAL